MEVKILQQQTEKVHLTMEEGGEVGVEQEVHL